MYNIYLSYRIFRRAYNKNKRATLKTLNRVSKLKLNLMKIIVIKDTDILRNIRDGVAEREAVKEIQRDERVSIDKAKIILGKRDKEARRIWKELERRVGILINTSERVEKRKQKEIQEKMKRLEDRWGQK